MSTVVMAVILGVLGFYIVYPIVLIFINSFNVAELASDPPRYSLENWRHAFREPLIFEAVKNTFLIYVLYTSSASPWSSGSSAATTPSLAGIWFLGPTCCRV
jgi:ABC-type spermidine/putrescine transport system permease subunit II